VRDDALSRVEDALRSASDERVAHRLRARRATLRLRTGGDARDELRKALASVDAPELRAELRVDLGIALRVHSDLDGAERILAAVGDDRPDQQARAAFELANVHRARGDTDAALACLDQAELLAGQHRLPRLQMLVAGNRASCERQRERHLEAEVAARRALELATSLGDEENTAHIAANLATLCTMDGRADEALRLLREARACYRRSGLLRSDGFAAQGQGLAHLQLGNLHASARHFAEAAERFRATGFRRGQGYALGILGRLAHAAGRAERALQRYDEALQALQDEAPGRLGQVHALAALAAVEAEEPRNTPHLRQARALLGDHPRGPALLSWVQEAAEALRSDPQAAAEVHARLASPALDRQLLW
jgi:tetratricopeptide (TPR) repeat protein